VTNGPAYGELEADAANRVMICEQAVIGAARLVSDCQKPSNTSLILLRNALKALDYESKNFHEVLQSAKRIEERII
jgi:hypothetical protein